MVQTQTRDCHPSSKMCVSNEIETAFKFTLDNVIMMAFTSTNVKLNLYNEIQKAPQSHCEH